MCADNVGTKRRRVNRFMATLMVRAGIGVDDKPAANAFSGTLFFLVNLERNRARVGNNAGQTRMNRARRMHGLFQICFFRSRFAFFLMWYKSKRVLSKGVECLRGLSKLSFVH